MNFFWRGRRHNARYCDYFVVFPAHRDLYLVFLNTRRMDDYYDPSSMTKSLVNNVLYNFIVDWDNNKYKYKPFFAI